jgi:tRNA G18 (ribose-2'-O)-methylase SpoU
MPVIALNDASDPRLADYRSLTDVELRRRIEPAEGIFIAESAEVISRALAAGMEVRSVLVEDRWLTGMADSLAIVERQGAPIFVGDRQVLESIAGFHVHRGALAAMARPALPAVGDLLDRACHGVEQPRVVVLEGIVDHTNVGAIFRSVAGLGATAVLVSPTCADPLYRRSVRVSMGTVFQVPWTRMTDVTSGLQALRSRGFVVAALALRDDSQSLDELVAQDVERLAVALGAEGDGLSAAALEAADVVVRIPMRGGVDSLNVAAASAVALWALRGASPR